MQTADVRQVAVKSSSTAPTSTSGAAVSPYRRVTHSDSGELAYRLQWGVDNLEVRRTNSGALIRCSYRVVDADKAELVQDKRAEPYLIGERSRAMLKVPEMSNIGKLRQTESIENGKDYWMLFSNKGDYIKAGDRVDVVIGTFYVNGLVVQ